MSCTHQRDDYVDNGYYDWDGEWVEDMRWETKNTTRDLNTHEYQCTQCNQVFTYHGPLFTPSNGETAK